MRTSLSRQGGIGGAIGFVRVDSDPVLLRKCMKILLLEAVGLRRQFSGEFNSVLNRNGLYRSNLNHFNLLALWVLLFLDVA
jgi:hypothetical protein